MFDPTDPAAVFMQLYDQLPDDAFAQRKALRWELDPDVQRNAYRVYEHVLEHGVVDPQQVEDLLQDGESRGVFTVLRGIDWALAHVNPFDPIYDQGNLTWLAVRYVRTGQLNDIPPDGSPDEGALLPRCAYPGRPRGTNDKSHYFSVQRVTPESWRKIRYERIKPRHEPYFQPDEPIPVGCAPLLESLDDIKFDLFDGDGESVFSLAPVDSPSLRERISNVIRKLDEARAAIAVMPESTLTDDLLTCWKDIAYSTAARHKTLRWLLAGSGPLGTGDPPPNRAVLLDRWTGDSLLAQDKLAGFTLTAEQARDWNLGNQPANGSAAEYLAGGSSISVRESSLGRLAVLICEDLNQSARWERELIECGISHLMVPIFAKPIMQYGWERHAAERQVDNLGAWLIIANSLVVQQAMNPAPTDSERHTCLIAGPSGPSRSKYTYDLQFGSAATGDDLGKTLLNGEYKLPTIRAAMIHDKWLGNGSRPSPP